jgi:hypothetical protein
MPDDLARELCRWHTLTMDIGDGLVLHQQASCTVCGGEGIAANHDGGVLCQRHFTAHLRDALDRAGIEHASITARHEDGLLCLRIEAKPSSAPV